jgi:signal transduction histidine kinase/ligand-binding sensor domain-containing protein
VVYRSVRTATARTSFALFLLLALVCPNAYPLDRSRFLSQYGHVAWRTQDGYFPGSPEALAQTADGYIWVGTYSGLVRFDGVRFTPWSSLEDKELPDYRIFSLLGGKDGSLWIGTGYGVARWKAGHLTNFPEIQGRVNAILEDAGGSVWIARSQVVDGRGPLCRLTGEAPRCFGKLDGIPFPNAIRMAADSDGNLWLGGQDGLCRWRPGSATTYFGSEIQKHGLLLGIVAIATGKNGELWISLERMGGNLELQQLVQGKWERHPLPNIPNQDQGISALLVDRDGTLWVGTGRRGIYRILADRIDHFASVDGLSSDAVAGFFQDREGTLWVASSKGVDTFRDLPVTTYSLKEGLTADSVSTVLAARDGTIYLGNSGALDMIKQGKISGIRSKYGLPGRDVTTLFEDHLGRLWLGVDSGLYVYSDGTFHPILKPDGTSLGVIFGITEDTKHSIWARAATHLVRVDDLKLQQDIALPDIARSFSIAADPLDGIWLGFVNGDLGHYHNDRLEMFPADPKVSVTKIRRMFPETDGTVWGVTEKGLVRWKDGKHAVLTTRNGLPCDELFTAVKDEHGAFWLYTRCGLVSISAQQLARWQENTNSVIDVTTLDIYDGVQPGITPLQPESSRSPDGRLWFANEVNVQSFQPGNILKNTLPPNIVVERVVADGVSYVPGNNFRLPPLVRSVEIDYTALSLVVPQRVRFRYLLEGHDARWQDPQTRREAFYNDLRPGKYRFRVIACNNDGVWNDAGSMIEFSVAPAFFQRTSFSAVMIFLLAGLLWAVYLARLRQVAAGIRSRMEARLSERERIARELHDTLLQSIQGLVLKFHAVAGQIPPGEKSRQSLENALDRADQVLAQGRDRVLNLRASSEWPADLADSLRLVGEEFLPDTANTLTVVVEGTSRRLHPVVREEVLSIGREAIVNAFRHSNSARIEVELSYEPRHLNLRVRDDGRGIDPEVLKSGGRQGHWGLRGMRERAMQIGAHLDIWSSVDSGTEVDLRVPAKKAYLQNVARPRWLWLRRVLSRNN